METTESKSASPSPPSPPLGEELAGIHSTENSLQTDPIYNQSQATSNSNAVGVCSKTKQEKQSTNDLHQEPSFQNADTNLEDTDENIDTTESSVTAMKPQWTIDDCRDIQWQIDLFSGEKWIALKKELEKLEEILKDVPADWE